MTKQKFKKAWNKDDSEITRNDTTKCAVEQCLSSSPSAIDLSKEELIKFKNLLGIFHKDFKERANTDIDLFVNICNNALYDMMKEIDKE